jgi:TldD protein
MVKRRPCASLLLLFTFELLTGIPCWAASPPGEKPDVLLTTMQEELQRAQTSLGKLDPAPYFLSYSVYDQSMSVAVGSEGSLMSSTRVRRRAADVTMRIGTAALDNSHQQNRGSARTSGSLALEDDRNAIARELWRLTYEEYRKASKAYASVKTNTQVEAKEEDTSPDFSEEKPPTHSDYKEVATTPDQKALEKFVRQYSAQFRRYPYVYSSLVLVNAQKTRFHFLSTEGNHVVAPTAFVRVSIQAETRAEDGMELMRVETFQAESVDHLPPASEIAAKVEKMATDLKALRDAPVAEPFDGPALLSGRASAVFFHEVLGHRLEGHRQRGEQEG